ncbi:MAG: phosphate propanoyltransferase [Parcubacteria group bacterium]
MPTIKIEVSARHVHLTRHDLEKLFGDGYELKIEKDLSQPGQFAAAETVTLAGPKRSIENVRVMGPCRQHTQVEISKSDSFFLGSPAPVRLSGKVIGSGAIKIIGPKGEIESKEGLIVAKRHLHLNKDQAHELGVANAQTVKVEIDGPRALIFDEVETRINEEFDAAFHIDTDEANAAGIDRAGEGIIIL